MRVKALMSFSILAPTLITITTQSQERAYDITLHPCWDILEPIKDTTLTAPWVHVATIIIKKTTPEHIHLEKLSFKWNGKSITHLSASLYRKECRQSLQASEKNFICDGTWSKKYQKLIFSFHRSENLDVINEFCLVFMVPKSLEFLLQRGFFELDMLDLPDQIHHVVKQKQLLLDLSGMHL